MHWKYFGKVPLCNHRADRGLFFHGFCLPLCARCSGILLGAFAGTVLLHLPFTGRVWVNVPASFKWLAGSAVLLPAGIDGSLQNIFGIESTNTRRIITGLMAGTGCAVLEEMLLRAIL